MTTAIFTSLSRRRICLSLFPPTRTHALPNPPPLVARVELAQWSPPLPPSLGSRARRSPPCYGRACVDSLDLPDLPDSHG